VKRRVVLLGTVGILGSILIRGLATPAGAEPTTPPGGGADTQTTWLFTASQVNPDGTTTVVIPAHEVPGFVGVDPDNIDLTTGLQIGVPIQVSPPVSSPQP
jgi:hypothetical protein